MALVIFDTMRWRKRSGLCLQVPKGQPGGQELITTQRWPTIDSFLCVGRQSGVYRCFQMLNLRADPFRGHVTQWRCNMINARSAGNDCQPGDIQIMFDAPSLSIPRQFIYVLLILLASLLVTIPAFIYVLVLKSVASPLSPVPRVVVYFTLEFKCDAADACISCVPNASQTQAFCVQHSITVSQKYIWKSSAVFGHSGSSV